MRKEGEVALTDIGTHYKGRMKRMLGYRTENRQVGRIEQKVPLYLGTQDSGKEFSSQAREILFNR